MAVKINVQMNTRKIAQKLEALKNDNVMYQIHNEFARMCNPYVPMSDGVLSQTLQISKDSVTYGVPYAHYQYVGEVYGPNIPIKEDGIIVGWFSPPGQKKKPTGRQMEYSKEMHPLASKEWDKAMMKDKGKEFRKNVSTILMERFEELYG